MVIIRKRLTDRQRREDSLSCVLESSHFCRVVHAASSSAPAPAAAVDGDTALVCDRSTRTACRSARELKSATISEPANYDATWYDYLTRSSTQKVTSISLVYHTEAYYDTIRYNIVYLTCSKKLTCSQLSPPHRGTNRTRGQSNLTKSASRGAHSPVRGHPRSKVVPLNSWGRVSY